MEDLGAGEMVRGMDSMGLTDMLEEGNFTVFAPRDQAFKNLLVQPDRVSAIPFLMMNRIVLLLSLCCKQNYIDRDF